LGDLGFVTGAVCPALLSFTIADPPFLLLKEVSMKKTRAIVFAILLVGIIFLSALSVISFNVFSTEPQFIDVASKKNGYAIKVDTPGAVIRDINIRNNGQGIYTTGIKIVADFVTIENCNVFDTPVGIAIWSSNNIIINCTFWGCKDEGIVLLGQSHLGANNNTFINCVFYNCCDGVELQHSSNNTFMNCRFLNNYHAGINGIHNNNNNNSFFSCEFVDNLYAIYFNESEGNEFINCTFMNNKRDIWDYKEN